MRTPTVTLLLPLLAACASTDPGTTLVRLTAGGEFVEVERAPEFSLVEVRQAPAGSVPSSMYALRGACAVARSRGKPYFASEGASGTSRSYRLTFPSAPTESELKGPTKRVFSLAECSLLGF